MSLMSILGSAGSALGGILGNEGVARAAAHTAPGIGEVYSATEALYHAGAATYDGITGDRDGAVNHGTQAVWSGINAIPAVSEALGVVDVAASITSAGAGMGLEAAGQDSSMLPGGIGDGLGQLAVGATRGLFGEDDSNWIASGNTPQGTARGEMMAGGAAALGVPTSGLGAAHGAGLGALGAKLMGTNPDGPTSGVGSAGLVGDSTEALVSSLVR